MSDFHFASRVVRFEIVIAGGDFRFDSDDGKAPGGFCCFSPSKSREKKEFFPKGVKGLREAFCCFSPPKSREREKSFFLVLLGPKVPKSSARRFPRDCASRGAARGAQDQAYALPRDGRAAARTLFFRVKRECGFVVPPLAAKDMIKINTFRQRVLFFTPQGDSRLGSDGGKADGGLKARAAGTVCLQTRE